MRLAGVSVLGLAIVSVLGQPLGSVVGQAGISLLFSVIGPAGVLDQSQAVIPVVVRTLTRVRDFDPVLARRPCSRHS